MNHVEKASEKTDIKTSSDLLKDVEGNKDSMEDISNYIRNRPLKWKAEDLLSMVWDWYKKLAEVAAQSDIEDWYADTISSWIDSVINAPDKLYNYAVEKTSNWIQHTSDVASNVSEKYSKVVDFYSNAIDPLVKDINDVKNTWKAVINVTSKTFDAVVKEKAKIEDSEWKTPDATTSIEKPKNNIQLATDAISKVKGTLPTGADLSINNKWQVVLKANWHIKYFTADKYPNRLSEQALKTWVDSKINKKS